MKSSATDAEKFGGFRHIVTGLLQRRRNSLLLKILQFDRPNFWMDTLPPSSALPNGLRQILGLNL